MGKGVIKGIFKIILRENVPVNLKSKSDTVCRCDGIPACMHSEGVSKI